MEPPVCTTIVNLSPVRITETATARKEEEEDEEKKELEKATKQSQSEEGERCNTQAPREPDFDLAAPTSISLPG